MKNNNSDELTAFFEALKKCEAEFQVALSEANSRLADNFDIVFFLNDAERLLKQDADKISTEALNGLDVLISGQIEQARNNLAHNRIDQAKVGVLTIYKNMERFFKNRATYSDNKFRDEQSAKGSIGAKKRWAKNAATTEYKKIVERLARNLDAEPAELWTQLYGNMDSQDLSPTEPKPCLPTKKQYYLYGEDQQNKVTFEAFRKLIQRLRNGAT